MSIIGISTITILCYLIASFVQGYSLVGDANRAKKWFLMCGFLAVCFHAILLHEWIDIRTGQNLDILNLLSLAVWLISLFIIVISLIKPVGVLAVFVFPIASISILLIITFPDRVIINTMAHPDTLFHILLAVFTFCVLCVSGLLAVLLAMQERLLRYKKLSWLVRRLPPLEAMETLLFQTISLGFVLLSSVLVTSVYFYHGILFQRSDLIQKTVLVVSIWIIFAVLLIGRYVRGWRGKKAIYGTWVGVILMFVVYFGSKLLISAPHLMAAPH